MPVRYWIASLALLGVLSCSGKVPDPKELGSSQNLSILYAGYPGSSRESAWVGLLKSCFKKVDTIKLSDLDMAKAGPYDVVLADWSDDKDDEDHYKHLEPSFTKPLVMLGVTGSRLVEKSKTTSY
jgi:hypothetical protein